MTQVRYIGSNVRLFGQVGTVVEEARHLSLSSGEVAPVFFPKMPKPVSEWNLRSCDLEAA
jgi:hypothetical protein